MDWTVIGTVIGAAGLIYATLRNFKTDIKADIVAMEKRLDLQDERIFLLATGKTLQQAMIEAKMASDTRIK